MSRNLEIPEIVTKLIGRIEPAGDANQDIVYFDNLQEAINLTNIMIDKIILVARHKDSYEHSVKQIGIEADKFITNLKELVNE